MKFVAMLLAAALSTSAFAQDRTADNPKDKASVNSNIIDTARNSALVGDGVINAVIDDAIVFTPVVAADFSVPQNDPQGVSITREKPYVVHQFKNAATLTQGQNEMKSKAIEGTRAKARLTQVKNEAISGVLIVDIRQIISINTFDNGDIRAELPDIRQSTFSLPLREGTQSQQVGPYKSSRKHAYGSITQRCKRLENRCFSNNVDRHFQSH
jgi:hypothetical protein